MSCHRQERLLAGAAGLAPLLISLIAPAQATDPLQRGLALFGQHQYEAALTQFEEARRRQPGNASIDNFIGITETRLGRADEADKDYETAIHIDPKLAGPHTNLGFNYLGRKQYDLAEKQLRTALALDSSDPYVHYYLAVVYLSTSREKQALPHIEPAATLLGSDPAAALLAIKACLSSDASAQALRLADLLEQHAQLSSEQEYALAKLFEDRQMYAASAAHFRRVAELQPDSWQNQYNLALALVKAKDTAQALPLLATLSRDHANDANVLSSLAAAYEAAGENPLALDAYQKAIVADPSNPDRYLDCTRLLIDLDRYKEATEIVQRGIASAPDDYPLTIRLGAIQMMTGQQENARKIYRQAVAEHPGIALGYVALAQSYMKEGKDEEALQVLTEARGAVPRDFALEYVFGLVSFQLGQQSQAMEAFKNAEGLEPTVVEPHYQLGLLYMKMQAWSDARGEFERVLALDPQNAATYYQLSRAYQRLGETGKAQEMAKQAGLLNNSQRQDAIKAQQLRFGVPTQK